MRIQTIRPNKVGFSNPRVVPAATLTSEIKWDRLTGNISINLQADGGNLDMEIKRDQAVVLSRSFRLLAENPQAQRKIIWKNRQASIRFDTSSRPFSNSSAPGQEVIQLIFANVEDVQSLLRVAEGYFSIILFGQTSKPAIRFDSVSATKPRVGATSIDSSNHAKEIRCQPDPLTKALNPLSHIDTEMSASQTIAPKKHESASNEQPAEGSIRETVKVKPSASVAESVTKSLTVPPPSTMKAKVDIPTDTRSVASSSRQDPCGAQAETPCDPTEALKRRLLQDFKPTTNASTDNLTSSPPIGRLGDSGGQSLTSQRSEASNRSELAVKSTMNSSSQALVTSPPRGLLRDSFETDSRLSDTVQVTEDVRGSTHNGEQTLKYPEESLISFSPGPSYTHPPDRDPPSASPAECDKLNKEVAVSDSIDCLFSPPPNDYAAGLTDTQLLANELTFEELYPAVEADNTLMSSGRKRKRDELDDEHEEGGGEELETLDLRDVSITIETTDTYKAQVTSRTHSTDNVASPIPSLYPRIVDGHDQASVELRLGRMIDEKLDRFRASLLEDMLRLHPPAVAAIRAHWPSQHQEAPYHAPTTAYRPATLSPQYHPGLTSSHAPVMQDPRYLYRPPALPTSLVPIPALPSPTEYHAALTSYTPPSALPIRVPSPSLALTAPYVPLPGDHQIQLNADFQGTGDNQDGMDENDKEDEAFERELGEN
ncbi:hypothetical protein I317_02953 [Kwoniella heveanensis CBS 569]|uniref:Uncharacterized protein n=1 Tax=Kwoniella heveanensis BCC8398 TaxID=1296120 RepID=A0A1B9GLK0_9TREE|nr:hypothetical protein I316_06466 [Kwoniella heveanensis BCC8398]OCF43243.1 hypothetical protein I317_02953 [Kwoniella heveanensis CBS 569]